MVGTCLWMGTCMNSCRLCNKPKLVCKGGLLGGFGRWRDPEFSVSVLC